MAKSKYAHFFVQKMLRYGSKDQKNQIVKVVEGQIAEVGIKSRTFKIFQYISCNFLEL